MSRYKLLFSIDENDKEIIIHLGNGVSIAFSSLLAYEKFIKDVQNMKEEIKDNLSDIGE